MKMIVLTTNYH